MNLPNSHGGFNIVSSLSLIGFLLKLYFDICPFHPYFTGPKCALANGQNTPPAIPRRLRAGTTPQ